MLEVGARFSNDIYILTAFDPSDGTCSVRAELVIEDTPVVMTGSVTWDEDVDDGDGGLG